MKKSFICAIVIVLFSGFNLYAADGDMIINGKVGVGTTSPAQKLSVQGNVGIGDGTSNNTMVITPSWYLGTGTWINMPTTGPSGIGSGGAGSSPWIGYAAAAGQWFTNSTAGDIAYRNTSGKLLFGNTAGNSAMAIYDNKIGIGTSSPGESLDVFGKFQVNSEGNIVKINNIATSFPSVQGATGTFLKNDGSGNLSWAAATGLDPNVNIILGSGNIGIGTTTPSADIEIKTDDTVAEKISSAQSANDTGTALQFLGGSSGATSRGAIGFSHTGTGSSTLFTNELADSLGVQGAGALQLGVGNTANLTIDSSGKVGIGTAAPGRKLTVSGGAISPAVGDSADAGIMFPTNPGGGMGDEAFMRYFVEDGDTTRLRIGIGNDEDDRLSLYQMGADRLTISNGNVGIGTTTPLQLLQVGNLDDGWWSATPSDGQIVLAKSWWGPGECWVNRAWKMGMDDNFSFSIGDYGFIGYDYCYTSTEGEITYTPYLTIGFAGGPYSGNVGIGTTTPSNKLDVAGSVWIEADCSAATFTDRTPYFGGNAKEALQGIKGKNGEIDHDSLPEFAKATITRTEKFDRAEVPVSEAFETVTAEKIATDKSIIQPVQQLRKDIRFDKASGKYFKVETRKVETTGRSLGAMVSIMVKRLQELTEEVDALKEELKRLKDQDARS